MNAWFQRQPAVRFALLLCAGILLQEWLSLSVQILLAVELVLILTAAGSLAMSRWKKIASPFLMAGVVALGAMLHANSRSNADRERLTPINGRDTVAIEAVVETVPERQGQWTTVVGTVARLKRGYKEQPGGQRIVLLARAGKTRFDSLDVGERVSCRGLVQEIPEPRNPGEFDYRRYLELNGIHGMVKLVEAARVIVLPSQNWFDLGRWTAWMQRRLYEILDRLHNTRHANFLKGVILGYRSDIALDIKQSFVDTGTIHILAVSGSNVAVVALVFGAVFSLTRFPRRWVLIGTGIGLAWYMAVTGMSASVVRATVMACLFLTASIIERKTNIYNTIAGAAVVLLVWNTNNLFDVGFQLSFAAVLSIVYFYPILTSFIKYIPEQFEEIKAVDAILKLFAVSLAAQLGTLPFTAYYFGRVSIVSLIANLVVVPVSGINVLLGFAELAVYPVSIWTAQCFAALNGFLVWFLLGFVKIAASVPYAYIETASMPVVYAILFYAVLFFFTTVNIQRPRVAAAFFICSLILATSILFDRVVDAMHPRLTVTMIDVGQGDALLLNLPNGKNVLVDAGPRSLRYDAGERVVAPFLKKQGITTLDAIIVSHAHADHIGGVPYLLDHFSVRTLMESAQPSSSLLYRQIRQEMDSRKVTRRVVVAGDRIDLDDRVRMYVLHPRMPDDSSSNFNNASVVLKLVYGSTRILFSGDAEEEAEAKLSARYGSFLESDVIKVGHHGSGTSSSEQYLALVSPHEALVSVAAINKFRHPSAAVMQRYRAGGARVRMTKEHGAIVLRSDGQHWVRVPWHNEE